jgi:hypothetical protein
MKHWELFERAVLDYQKHFFADSMIEHNKKYLGRFSKARRRIDIAIETMIGDFNLRIAIECKNYKKPLNVKTIESIVGLFNDIAANKGVIFSTSGYSPAAMNTAISAGIDLFTLKGSEFNNINEDIGQIPLLLDLRLIEAYRLAIATKTNLAIKTDRIATTRLCHADGSPAETVRDRLIQSWNNGKLPISTGTHDDIQLFEENVFINNEGELVPAMPMVSLLIQRKLYKGKLNKQDLKAVFDNLKERIVYEEFKIDFGQYKDKTISDLMSQLVPIEVPEKVPTIIMQIAVPLQ